MCKGVKQSKAAKFFWFVVNRLLLTPVSSLLSFSSSFFSWDGVFLLLPSLQCNGATSLLSFLDWGLALCCRYSIFIASWGETAPDPIFHIQIKDLFFFHLYQLPPSSFSDFPGTHRRLQYLLHHLLYFKPSRHHLVSLLLFVFPELFDYLSLRGAKSCASYSLFYIFTTSYFTTCSQLLNSYWIRLIELIIILHMVSKVEISSKPWYQ